MNRILIIIFLFASASCFATEQISDLLIIEKDTFYLKSFPLETLEFEDSPFLYGEFKSPHTACWRGYKATWKIIDDKLVLMEVEKVDSTNQKLDILDYFKRNNYQPKLVSGYVYADWYSTRLLVYRSTYAHKYPGLYLQEEFSWTKNKSEVQLAFEKGVLKENNMVNFNSFLIGDTLSLDFSLIPPGVIKKKSVNLQATIVDLRENMALVNIYSYDTDEKKEIEQIRKYFGNLVDIDTLLTNPFYWDKR